MWLLIMEEDIYSTAFTKILSFSEYTIYTKPQPYRSRKSRKHCRILQNIKSDTAALAERDLVHSRVLVLKDYVAFLRSHSEHTATLQAHYMNMRINQLCYCPPDSPNASAIVLFQEPACWPFPDCQLKTKVRR